MQLYLMEIVDKEESKECGGAIVMNSDKDEGSPFFDVRVGDLEDRREAQLVASALVSRDVRYMRFQFPALRKGQRVGIAAGRHLHFTANVVVDGVESTVARSYSLISDPDNNGGEVELIVKVYPRDAGYPLLGSFSRHLNSMKIGESLLMSGPWGQFYYDGSRIFRRWTGEAERYRRVGMIAGGVGIAPMICMLRRMFTEKRGVRQISLLYTARTLDDVIFRDELEAYARKYANRFRLLITLTGSERSLKELSIKSGARRHYTTGRINADMCRRAMPRLDAVERNAEEIFEYENVERLSVDDDVLILVCGRESMNERARECCAQLGYQNVHKF